MPPFMEIHCNIKTTYCVLSGMVLSLRNIFTVNKGVYSYYVIVNKRIKMYCVMNKSFVPRYLQQKGNVVFLYYSHVLNSSSNNFTISDFDRMRWPRGEPF